MGRLISDREGELQRLLIPVNILVCILSLIAALTLFLTPIIKIDFGKILRNEDTISYVDEMIDGAVEGDLEESEKDEINYKPVVAMLVKNILSKGEGEISISAVSALRVLTSGDNKAEKVLDELFFGEKALITGLINSVVDGLADMFSTDEGRTVLEEAILSTLTNQIIDSVGNKELAEAMMKNMAELSAIFKELGNPEAELDNGEAVAQRFVDKLNESLGEGTQISEANRQSVVDHITGLYSDTKAELKEGESVSFESIICVTLSSQLDLGEMKLGDLVGGMFSSESKDGDEENGEDGESGVHIKFVEGEVEGSETENESTDGEETDGDEENRTIVTNYNDLLLEMGFDKDAKDTLKENIRTTLSDGLNDMLKENGVDEFLEYYGFVFYGMLVFIVPWVFLFLFAFFHLFASNKRFMMWYVKLLCWIPPLIWVALRLLPTLATKISVIAEFWNGDQSALVKAALGGISTYTWISGLCYVVLWLVSIFWAFPIKHKIRKERKNPQDYEDDDDEIEF